MLVRMNSERVLANIYLVPQEAKLGLMSVAVKVSAISRPITELALPNGCFILQSCPSDCISPPYGMSCSPGKLSIVSNLPPMVIIFPAPRLSGQDRWRLEGGYEVESLYQLLDVTALEDLAWTNQ